MIEPQSNSAHKITNALETRVRLNYLDGVRGLAALMVLIHHAYGFAIGDRIWEFPGSFSRIYNLLLFGHYAVDIFIVLSGYCLMLPVARDTEERLSGGLKGYFFRRARRMIPPYYIALFLSVILAFVTPYLIASRGVYTGLPLNTWDAGGLISHILLVHNWNSQWIGQINDPMWSVATEWQIYFVFPLLLLIWRRRGLLGLLAATLLSAVLLSAPYLIAGGQKLPLQEACPWYIALFAMGMLAAAVNFSARGDADAVRRLFPWRFAPLILIVATGVCGLVLLGKANHALSDHLAGGLFAAFLVFATHTLTRTSPTRGNILRLLEHPIIVRLGIFSYSLYLIHVPLLSLLRSLVPHRHFSPTLQFLVVIPLEIASCIALAYLFHLAFERPFMRSLKPKAVEKLQTISAK